MPLICVRSSCAPPADPAELQRELSREVAALLGKPERYVMTLLETGLAMSFAADVAPCCLVEVRSIGQLDGDRPRRLSASLAALLKRHLALPADRIYIDFQDVPARLWGWNGDTFG